MKKIIFALVAIAMAAGAFTFIACNKEDRNDKKELSTPASKGYVFGISDPILIGKLVQEHIVCGLDVEFFSDAIYNATGVYVAEKIEILDTLLSEPDGTAELYMVLYNIEEEATESFWIEITKQEGNYLYAPPGGGDGNGTNVMCVRSKQNPCKSDCYKQFDDKDRFIGCGCGKDGNGDGGCETRIIKDSFFDKLGDAMVERARNIKIQIELGLVLIGLI